VAWPSLAGAGTSVKEYAVQLPAASAVVAVGGDFGFQGPALFAVAPGGSDQEYELEWPGNSWGYIGTGPRLLAMLIQRLLGDITARAPTVAPGVRAAGGLEDLTVQPWPRGTVFTRQQLVDARDGKPLDTLQRLGPAGERQGARVGISD
jgi:hypothetical protein